MRSLSKRGGTTSLYWKLRCPNHHSPSMVVKASHNILMMVAIHSRDHHLSKVLVAIIPLVQTAFRQVRYDSRRTQQFYLQSQTLAPQSHSILPKTGHNRFHMPAKHHHLTNSKHNIQSTTLATAYHPETRVRHHQTPILTVRNQRTIIRKNSPHPPTQAPRTIGPNHMHLILSSRSPRANIHPRSTLLQTASRMGKRSKHKYHTPANKLHILTLLWALCLRKTIMLRTIKHHLHSLRLKRHLLAWAKTHIRCSTRDRLQAGIKRITLHRRNSRGMLLRRQGILMISTDKG